MEAVYLHPSDIASALDLIRAATQAAKPQPHTATRFGVTYCTLCNFVIDYCRCGTTPAEGESPKDGAETGLERRARECKGKT